MPLVALVRIRRKKSSAAAQRWDTHHHSNKTTLLPVTPSGNLQYADVYVYLNLRCENRQDGHGLSGWGGRCCCCVSREKLSTHIRGRNISDVGEKKGRAGLVAFRKYRGGVEGVSALGRAYYKGGFEQRMNRREAALILQLRWVPLLVILWEYFGVV